MKKRVALAIMVTGLIGLSGVLAYAADEDLIPPEILRQMDGEIRAGQRPRVASIRQGDIFGLRENPKIDADFVTLNFNIDTLSSVQRDIVEKWIRSGSNRLLLRDEAIRAYTPLFHPVTLTISDVWRAELHYSPAKLLIHPVNTDCKNVAFRNCRFDESSSPYAIPAIKTLPQGGIAIVEGARGEVLCGSFPLEKGEIVFKLSTSGVDARRWELNFWHWALGLPVPGVAETTVAGSSSLTLAEAAKYDVVTLKNGDTISGTILNQTFTIQTSYAELPFDRAKIEKIVFEGAGANLDSVILRVGDKMSGVVKDPQLQIRLLAGQTTEVARDKMKSIQMRKVESQ